MDPVAIVLFLILFLTVISLVIALLDANNRREKVEDDVISLRFSEVEPLKSQLADLKEKLAKLESLDAREN